MPKLGEEKTEFVPRGTTLPELVREMKELKERKQRAEKEAEEAGSALHAIATKHIPPLMETLETDEFNVPDIGRVELRQEVYVHFLKDDTQKFYKWLEANGHEDLISPYIFPATLKSWATEQLEQGAALPDVLKAAFVPTAKLLAARKK